MAKKRMFNITIVDSDAFLDMPLSTQCLYFHLNMRADDDGFVGNPKKIQKIIGASDDDLRLLLAKRFILGFEDGVIVIKHWRIHNTIRKDRYTQTTYTDELKALGIKENGAYSFSSNVLEVPCIPNGNQMATECQPLGNPDIDIDIGLDKGIDKKKETFVSVIASYTESPELIDALKGYVEMRQKQKGFTIRALKLNLNTLNNLAIDDNTKIDIVNQSIANGWKSFYALKKDKKELSREEQGFAF